MAKATVSAVVTDIDFVRSVFTQLLELLPSFEIASKEHLPFGLKPHTRSVSWIVEQVITQQTKFHHAALGLTDVDFAMPDASLHNCILFIDQKRYWVNIKIHDMSKRHNKSDIAAVEKLYKQYCEFSEYGVIYVCFGINFRSNLIEFDPNYLQIFSPQFMPIYVNPRNDKLQALYNHKRELRSRNEFLDMIKRNSRMIAL
jgi:hypothetical protein